MISLYINNHPIHIKPTHRVHLSKTGKAYFCCQSLQFLCIIIPKCRDERYSRRNRGIFSFASTDSPPVERTNITTPVSCVFMSLSRGGSFFVVLSSSFVFPEYIYIRTNAVHRFAASYFCLFFRILSCFNLIPNMLQVHRVFFGRALTRFL